MEREELFRKLRKMKAHEESAREIGSEAEAEAFASHISKLLADYKLEMTDVQFSQAEKSDPINQFLLVWDKYPDMKSTKRRTVWIEQLAVAICKFNGCLILVHRASNDLTIVGKESNRIATEYMLVCLVRSANRIADDNYRKFYYQMKVVGRKDKVKGYKASFLNGFVNRLGDRLQAEQDKLKQKTEEGESLALVRVNTERKDVTRWTQQNMNVGRGSPVGGRKSGNAAGYEHGQNTANRVKIGTKGIGQKSQERIG